MTTLTATEARANLYRVIDEAAESHIPVRITSKRNNAVLLSEKDWDAIQETLYPFVGARNAGINKRGFRH